MDRTWALHLGFALLACSASDEAAPYFVESRDAEAEGDSGMSPRRFPSSPSGGGGTPTTTEGGGSTPTGESCTGDSDCEAGAVCYQGTCVGEGALRFSLSWELDTDYDLHVRTPAGTHISYSNPSGGGGVLDVDDCVGSVCRVPGGTHVENIFFAFAPASGVYEYWAHNFSGELTGHFELEVNVDGRVVETKSGTLPLVEPFDSTHYMYDY